jgi:hypothetical protein
VSRLAQTAIENRRNVTITWVRILEVVVFWLKNGNIIVVEDAALRGHLLHGYLSEN